MAARATIALLFACAIVPATTTRPTRRQHMPLGHTFLSTACLDGVYAHTGAGSEKLCNSGYNLRIDRWHGRFGNVLLQVLNGVYIAEKTRSRLTVPDTPVLTRTEWDLRQQEDVSSPCSHVTITGGDPNFWHARDCPLLTNATPSDKRDVFTRHVVPHLKLNIADVDPQTLVIYLRSGDVFAGNGGSEWYVQPPVSFYRSVLRRRKWNRVVVVTDHSNATLVNPVLDVLKREWPAIETAKASLAEDIATLIAASHIVSARSTLADLVLLIGDLKRCAYLPACEGHEEERSAGGVCYMMDGYTAQGTWDNSATQRQAMLAYEGVREGRTWGSGC
jgi:hypothetical protein